MHHKRQTKSEVTCVVHEMLVDDVGMSCGPLHSLGMRGPVTSSIFTLIYARDRRVVISISPQINSARHPCRHSRS